VDLSKLAEINFLDADQILRVLDSGEGIFHPTGSTRVAVDGNIGTVDSNLRVLEFQNLYLVSTSVLISGGGANPTMTELMLGLRLVDHFKYLDRQAERNLSNE
jgi:choline dehydrogenase-like flavoprotein